MLLGETITVKPTPIDPTKPDVSALAKLIVAHTQYDGICTLAAICARQAEVWCSR
jgi:hypothetical protein